jgi:hypothetical protein
LIPIHDTGRGNKSKTREHSVRIICLPSRAADNQRSSLAGFSALRLPDTSFDIVHQGRAVIE